jgi:hypothetical protein
MILFEPEHQQQAYFLLVFTAFLLVLAALVYLFCVRPLQKSRARVDARRIALKKVVDQLVVKCMTCGHPYVKENVSLCSNAFHCCRDCSWSAGRITELCKYHAGWYRS